MRKLREERRISQTRLAAHLGITQGHLSQLERGRRFFTAEQFLSLLKLFNITADAFESAKADAGSKIQNALARQGAAHLYERDDILPSEQLKDAHAAIREALISGESPRQVTAIGPVIVAQASRLNFNRLRAEFAQLGLENRFHWAINCVLEALRKEQGSRLLARKWAIKYRQAEALIDAYFAPHFGPQGVGHDADDPKSLDVLGAAITSPETLRELLKHRPPLAGRWRIVTDIELDDFVRALRAARD